MEQLFRNRMFRGLVLAWDSILFCFLLIFTPAALNENENEKNEKGQ